MARLAHRALLALVASVMLWPSAAAAQEAGSPAPAGPPAPASAPATTESSARVARPATVNGLSITDEDIALVARRFAEEAPEAPLELVLLEARRRIAEEVLLAGEARRLGVELTDREVEGFLEQRFGEKPDFVALAAENGTTLDRQRELARRMVLADLYLMHRVGLRAELREAIAPDPLLSRNVAVTPAQIKELFQSRREELGLPERALVELHPCLNAAEAEALHAALLAGQSPSRLPLEREIPLAVLDEVFPPEVARFLREEPPGSLLAHSADDGAAVLRLVRREPARAALFSEWQERLRNQIQGQHLAQARQHLVRSLAQQSTYWPRDLFEPVAKP